MYGKPLISCEIGTGTSFINIDCHTGLVVPPCDHLSLSKAMQSLYTDSALAKSYGLNAYKRFKAIFTSEKMITDYISLYNNIYNTHIK